MSSKKQWCSPHMYSLNLKQTQIEITTPSNVTVDMSTSYEAPVEIAHVSSSSKSEGSSTSSSYCFSMIS